MSNIIPVHNLQQWMGLHEQTRQAILQNIKLKDRLMRFLKERSRGLANTVTDEKGHYKPCPRCGQTGWIWEEPRHPGIHPSQVPQPCLLKIYYEMIGKEGNDKVDPKLQMIFDFGHAFHHMMQSYGQAGAWGPHYIPEITITQDEDEGQPLAKELMIEGHADADNLLLVEAMGATFEVGIVHEYKTINQDNFKKLAKPKPEHKMQATIYQVILDRPIVVYLYMNKNNQELLDFPVPFESHVWETVHQKIRVLAEHFRAKQEPPGNYGYQCNECKYVADCSEYRRRLAEKSRV